MRPVEQQLGVGPRNAEHRTDDSDRIRLGVVGQKVECLEFPALVEETCRQALDIRTHCRDRTGREDFGDETPKPSVVRWLQAQQRPLLVGMKCGPSCIGFGTTQLGMGVDVRVIATESPVSQSREHIIEARDHPTIGRLAPENRRCLPQLTQHRVRVGDERRIVDIEPVDETAKVHGPNLDGRCSPVGAGPQPVCAPTGPSSAARYQRLNNVHSIRPPDQSCAIRGG